MTLNQYIFYWTIILTIICLYYNNVIGYILSAFKTLVHEIGHWIIASLTWSKINYIQVNYSSLQSQRDWFKGVCNFSSPISQSRFIDSLIAYSWHLNEAFIIFLTGYFLYINKFEWVFYLYSIFFLIYLIYWYTIKDKLVWTVIVVFLCLIALDHSWEYSKWLITYQNSQSLKEWFLMIMFWWLIGSIIYDYSNYIRMLFTWDHWKWSDQQTIWRKIFIPKTIIVLSWIVLNTLSLLFTYYILFWSTHISSIDSKISQVLQVLPFKK